MKDCNGNQLKAGDIVVYIDKEFGETIVLVIKEIVAPDITNPLGFAIMRWPNKKRILAGKFYPQEIRKLEPEELI